MNTSGCVLVSQIIFLFLMIFRCPSSSCPDIAFFFHNVTRYLIFLILIFNILICFYFCDKEYLKKSSKTETVLLAHPFMFSFNNASACFMQQRTKKLKKEGSCIIWDYLLIALPPSILLLIRTFALTLPILCVFWFGFLNKIFTIQGEDQNPLSLKRSCYYSRRTGFNSVLQDPNYSRKNHLHY